MCDRMTEGMAINGGAETVEQGGRRIFGSQEFAPRVLGEML